MRAASDTGARRTLFMRRVDAWLAADLDAYSRVEGVREAISQVGHRRRTDARRELPPCLFLRAVAVLKQRDLLFGRAHRQALGHDARGELILLLLVVEA